MGGQTTGNDVERLPRGHLATGGSAIFARPAVTLRSDEPGLAAVV